MDCHREVSQNLVSVVVPAWNGGEYLREALESVSAQTYQPLEVIVVDDGSTDHTRQVCDSFGSLVRYYRQENDGTFGAGARGRGILEARGEWIALLDQDDRWLPTKIDRQVQALKSCGDAGVVFTGFRYIDPMGEVLDQAGYVGPSGDVFHALLQGCPYIASSSMIRRIVLARTGLPGAGDGAADWDLWLRIARDFPVIMLPECLTEYRVHPASFSFDRERLSIAKQLVLSRHQHHLHAGCSECRRAIRSGWSLTRRGLARHYLDRYHVETRAGRFRRALPHLCQALQSAPWEVLQPVRLLAVLKNGTLAAVRSQRSAGSSNIG